MELPLSGANFNTDDLIIDLDDGPAPQKPNGATPPPIPDQKATPESPPQKSAEDEAVDRLRKQMEAKLAAAKEENRVLREQAEQDRSHRLKAEGDARTAGFEKEWSDYTAATAAYDAAKNRIESLKGALKAAYDAGETDKAADFQAKIGMESAKMVQFEMAKDELHGRLEQRKTAPAPRETPAAPADPVEAFISQNKLTTKAAQWFRDNPDYVRDPEKMYLAIAADTAARKEGLARDSDDYFKYVNEYVGLDKSEDGNENKPAPKRGKSVPAAPVNGGRGSQFSSGNLDGNRVRMSQHLRELAESMYPTEKTPADAHKRYAKNAVELIKKGQLPKDFFDTH